MADIPLQQQSGLGDLSRTIVPKAGLALEPVFNAAERVHKETTADFNAQQMEKVKVKTIAAQNALNLVAEENRRNGIMPLRVQAVTGGDTFANREFLKTAQEISRTMTIDQVHSDLQAELVDLHTKYLTSEGQLDYDPANPDQDGAARFRSASFDILKKYHVAYAESPFVDDVFDAQMTAKFTGTVNTLAQQVKETQANKVIARYQTGLLEGMQQTMAAAYDEALTAGFAKAPDFKQAHTALIEPLVVRIKNQLRQLEASGADSGTMRQAILAAHDALTEQFKNGVFQELLQLPATTPQELAAKNKKIGDFVDYINRGGAFYENQIIKLPEEAEFDGGGYLRRAIIDLYKLNAPQGNEEYNQEFPNEAAFVAIFEQLIGTVKDPVDAAELRKMFNATRVELAISRDRMAGDKVGRKTKIDAMFQRDADGNLPGQIYRPWADEMQERNNNLVEDSTDPIALVLLDPKNGDHLISKAHQTLMTHVTDALAADNPVMTKLVDTVNLQRQRQGLPAINVKTAAGAQEFARLVADEDIGAYSAYVADQNHQRALNEWKDKPSVVTDNSRLPKATFEAAGADLRAAALQPDKTEFLRQAEMVAKVFVSTDGPYALDHNLDKLNSDKDGPQDFGLGSMLKVSSHAAQIAGVEQGRKIRGWWAHAEGPSNQLAPELAADIKMTQAPDIVKRYPGELDVLGAGGINTQSQRATVERLLQGAVRARVQGISNSLMGKEREVATDQAVADAADDVTTMLDEVRKNTALSANVGLGGTVWQIPDFIRASQPDLQTLSYVTSPVLAGVSQMSRDLGAAYGHLDLTRYKPVVKGNIVVFEDPNSSVYDTKELLWLPGGTPTDTTKFHVPGGKLKLVPPVTGQPVAYSTEGFSDAINDARRAELELQKDSWARMQQLMDFPAPTATPENR